MSTAPLRAASLGGTADDVEAQFYEALQKGDITQLMACWADEDEIVCVHPGGPRLVGVGQIRAAFETLFSHGTLRVRTEGVRRIEAMASAVHTLVERIELESPGGRQEVCVVSTNVYHKTAQGWRMVAHHASPGTEQEAQAMALDGPQVLH
ncbi:YybH family protein [Xylophilus sp. ASV27]|uniref:YybH family protein n=1 Tax=Xylophilus sp. ASV27 TaxID=2795129 RepID=UPI0018EA3F4B|nr:nuclear transport factor 2 family protein [Xylophilus sp. ASV27]